MVHETKHEIHYKENKKGENNRGEKMNGDLSKPRLCNVCDRASFLKCMECDTIYCSSRCQIKDWEQHQYKHAKSRPMKAQQASNNKHDSVNNRLAAAVNKEPIQINYTQNYKQVNELEKKVTTVTLQKTMEPDISARPSARQPMTAQQPSNSKHVSLNNRLAATVLKDKQPDIAAAMQACSMGEKPHVLNVAVSQEESMIDKTLRTMIVAREFKRSVSLEEQDEDGYSFVTISWIETDIDGNVFCWIIPFNLVEQQKFYKMAMNDIYSDHRIASVPVDMISKFKGHLVMAKIGGFWSRAQIVSKVVNNSGLIIGVEDIDSGKKEIVVLPKDQIKVPLEPDLLRSAYAMKVIFENVANPEKDLAINEVIKIRLTSDGDRKYAEVLMDAVKSEDKLEIEPEFYAAPVEFQERLFDKDLRLKDLHTGSAVKLFYLDGSKLESGLLHVCEATDENKKIMDQIFGEISAYVKANPNSNNYKGVPHELVLAKFEDGYFYRAVVLKDSKLDVKVHFLEYGSTSVVGAADVMRMPPSLMHTCCSHTVRVQFASKRSISEIDAPETREKMMRNEHFTARVVELIPDKQNKYQITLDDSVVVFK